MGEDSTTRFSARVGHYVKARPGYPKEFLEFLKGELGVTPTDVIADVGAGTGLLTADLVGMGNQVIAVEPNRDMRRAAEEMLGGFANFRSVEGTAENTTLENGSVDVVVAAQAFHWFEPVRTKEEFRRVLRPGGRVVLVWNDRKTSGAFNEAYEGFVQRFNQEPEVLHCRGMTKGQEKVIGEFFAPGGFRKRVFGNEQRLDFEGLKARVLSSSYMPMEGAGNYGEMVAAMSRLFQENAVEGRVVMEYQTVVYWGRV